MPNKTAVTWNALIAGYAANQMSQKAFQLFLEMERQHIQPTIATFNALLSDCTDFTQGTTIHNYISIWVEIFMLKFSQVGCQ